MIDHNLVLDVLPSRTIDAFHEVAKSMVAAGSEKECLDAYINCRRECLDECLLGLLKLKEGSIKDLGNIPYQNDMIQKWIKASNIAFRIIFPSDKRLYDCVFFVLSFVADVCFMEICWKVTI